MKNRTLYFGTQIFTTCLLSVAAGYFFYCHQVPFRPRAFYGCLIGAVVALVWIVFFYRKE